jgi:hypothetical protein
VIGGPRTCVVCGTVVATYVWHSRLGVAVCPDCPRTDVCGEDITLHTVGWISGKPTVGEETNHA